MNGIFAATYLVGGVMKAMKTKTSMVSISFITVGFVASQYYISQKKLFRGYAIGMTTAASASIINAVSMSIRRSFTPAAISLTIFSFVATEVNIVAFIRSPEFKVKMAEKKRIREEKAKLREN